jgi:nitroreductase
MDGDAAKVLSALRHTRQVRQFSDEPISQADLDRILNVARWSGSSTNWQPWRFGIIRDRAKQQRLAELAPHAKHVAGAATVLAIVMPGERPEWEMYDEGRCAERILVAAAALGLGAGIGWVTGKHRQGVAEYLGLAEPAYVRTLISLGHPSATARQPKSAPGEARKPLSELLVDL